VARLAALRAARVEIRRCFALQPVRSRPWT
jgi:hypothetical protein